jgi:hypothetical protein
VLSDGDDGGPRSGCRLMQTRRDVVFSIALGTLGASARAVAADAAARNFVTAIYSAYKGKNGNGISLDSEANIRRYFEPSLAASMIKDRKQAARHGDAPTLDYDPFVDGQDWEITGLDIAMSEEAPGKASATVTFRNFDKPTKVVLDLVKLKSDWRVADIAWQHDGKPETLRPLFLGR